MSATVYLQTEPAVRDPQKLWTQTDGKDFASVLKFQRCRELLAEQLGPSIGEDLVPDQWQTVGEILLGLQLITAALPAGYCAEWSEAYGDRFSYLDAELAGELADVEMVSR